MSTPEAYSHALRLLKTFSSNNAESIKDWTEWWGTHKEFAFQVFNSFNAPKSNLAEVIHAGWSLVTLSLETAFCSQQT